MSSVPLARRFLRRKLALEFLLIAGAIHLVLIVLVMALREGQVRRQFDADLIRRAERVAGAAAQDLVPSAAVAQAASAEVITRDMPSLLAQSRSLTGVIDSSSPGLSGMALPFPFESAETAPGPEPVFQRIDGEAIGRPGESFRVLTLHEEGPPPYYLQVAASELSLDASISSFRHLMFIFVLPGALLGTGVAAWLISGHFVRQIEEIGVGTQRVASSQPARVDMPSPGDDVGGMVVEMNSMLARLEGAFRAQERFIVDVTHELKTPVSVMLAEAQVLKKSTAADVERYRQFVESVEEEMRRLSSLLESFLTLARSGHGPRYISESLVDLTETTLTAMERCDNPARDRSINLNFVLPSDELSEAIAVRGDQELLTTLVANLVRSAIENSAPGAVVDVEVATQGEEAKVTVSHTRAAGNTAPSSKRSRELAFAVAQGIAELHGGEISTSQHDDRERAAVKLPMIRVA